MSDRWQGTGHFHPAKAWEKITRANKARAFEAKHPTKWWHDIVYGWGGLLLALALIASVVGTVVGLWGILR